MKPLAFAVEQGLEKAGIRDAQAADCRLLLKGKPLDPSTPIRFANLPKGAKIEVVTGGSHVV